MTAPRTDAGPKTALVTGASRGIGRAIAVALVARGYAVHGCARHVPDDAPDGVTLHRCDVADAAAVRALVATVADASGNRIDLLVNNAGVAGSNPLEPDADDALWHAIIDTNLTGAYLCAKSVLPHLPDGAGRIVNIASVLGLKGAGDQTAYTAAKHGVVGLTRALALAVAPRGITVNAVCPGWVATDMAAQRYREIGIDPADAAADTPLGRVATPEDVAGAVVFLAGPDAGHITGQTLTVDGGALA